ncbi:hypothetical protein Bca52824_009148 [Brassica carinata]|uniref:Uncharacterized protein n=1 Tax=Brassica carinata TaxID=52824 RepID=A0A8X7WC54_BRACI|nr:hypothetical protein Bca52824_009148 [Brassica carinata]
MAREKQERTTEEPLSPVSQLFVSPGFYSVIVFTLGFKTRCNPAAIVEGIKNTWIKLPCFSSKVVKLLYYFTSPSSPNTSDI